MPDSIVCPFCPLHCDDIVIDQRSGITTDCQRALDGFRKAIEVGRPRLGDQAFDTVEFSSFASALKFPQPPVVEVGWLSIEQAKQLQSLSEQIVIKPRGDDLFHAQTIARDGFDSATLADIKTHADVICMLGSFDVADRLTRLLQTTRATMLSRTCLSTEDLARLQDGEADSDPTLQALLDSQYAAILIGDSAFEPGNQLVSAESLLRFVRDRNGRVTNDSGTCRRTVIVRLDSHQNRQSVFRWRSNEVRATGRLPGLSNRWTIDIRLGSPVDSADEFVNAAPVRLQIGGSDPGRQSAEAYLPAATTGIHRRGTTYRGDGSVCLPLSAPLASDLQDAVTQLRCVLDAVDHA